MSSLRLSFAAAGLSLDVLLLLPVVDSLKRFVFSVLRLDKGGVADMVRFRGETTAVVGEDDAAAAAAVPAVRNLGEVRRGVLFIGVVLFIVVENLYDDGRDRRL
jgi:hypothetical protein